MSTLTPIPTAHPPIPAGVYLQIYRGGFDGTPAARSAALEQVVERTQKDGFSGVGFHGSPRELPAQWDRLAALASAYRLPALASWGLDGRVDVDGTDLTAEEKGVLQGEVLKHSTCVAGLDDAEGRWDRNTRVDDMDEAGALRKGEALRRVAPLAVVGDQCWWDMGSHGDVRRVPHGLNVFEGFPVDEFAVLSVNWYRFRQLYPNHIVMKRLYGNRRYEVMRAGMERAWAKIQPALVRAGLDRPLSVTVQAYDWPPNDLVHCLLDFTVTQGHPVIAWWEPHLNDPLFWRCHKAVQVLRREGFAVAGRSPEAIVRAYQTAYNARSSESQKIVADGACGLLTIATMGL